MTLSPQHALVLNVQLPLQASVPAPKPSEPQLSPPMFAPSHCSVPSMAPLPQTKSTQPLVSIVHVGEHASVPASKPCVTQSCPPKSAPSHVSVPSRTPLPH